MTKEWKLDLGWVAMLLAGIGWLAESTTIVWIGWWLVFVFQILVIGVATGMSMMAKNLKVTPFPGGTTLRHVAKSILHGTLFTAVWWATNIPLHWAVIPAILGLITTMIFWMVVLPQLQKRV